MRREGESKKEAEMKSKKPQQCCAVLCEIAEVQRLRDAMSFLLTDSVVCSAGCNSALIVASKAKASNAPVLARRCTLEVGPYGESTGVVGLVRLPADLFKPKESLSQTFLADPYLDFIIIRDSVDMWRLPILILTHIISLFSVASCHI